MSDPHRPRSKKKKPKIKQSQSNSRSKSPRPSQTNAKRTTHTTPKISHSYSAKNHNESTVKSPKKSRKTQTPPVNRNSPKSFKLYTPNQSNNLSTHTNHKKKPKTPKTPKSKPKTPKPKSILPPPKKPNKNHKNRSKTPKPKSRTVSSPSWPSKGSQSPKTKSKSKTKNKKSPKQRTISSPKPQKKKSKKSKRTTMQKPILKQSHSENVNMSDIIDHSSIDNRHTLSPQKSPKNGAKSPKNGAKSPKNVSKKQSNKAKKSETNKKRLFYGDLYSVKNKGKLQSLYKVKEKIGSGTFSTVRRGIRRRDKQEIAIKIITKTELSDTEARLIKREIGVMERLKTHENIVKLYDIFETTHHLYLIIEYCKGGELFDELINCTPKGWFSERETSQIIRQIAEGIVYMHTKNIIHRDLKLENVLISTKQSYNINKKKKKFSVDSRENTDLNTPNMSYKDNKSDRNLISSVRAEQSMHSNDDSDNDLDTVMNRRHSDCISQIPHSILYGHSASHRGPQTSIIIKISDFGLSKKLEPPPNNSGSDGMTEEKKETNLENTKKKRHKMPHILSKRAKKKKKDQFNDREFAVMATNCGTLYYVAPEILNNEAYNEKVDCWSLGVICYVLLCGSLPFYSENELEISELILKCKYDLGETDEHWLKVSDSAKDLIQKLLTPDIKHRYSAKQVLSHPFLTGQNKLTTNKRKSVKWNAGTLFGGKLGMKFKNILDSAKNISFQMNHESSDNEMSNSDFDLYSQSSISTPKKVKYKIPFDSDQ